MRLSIETKSFTMSMDLPEFQACVTAYRNWFQEILNSMDVPWSNGFIEGCNNKTKVLKRVCFGCGTSGTSEIGSFSAAVYRKNRAGAKHPDTVLDDCVLCLYPND